MQVLDCNQTEVAVPKCLAVLAALVFALPMTGCVLVPYSPPANTEQTFTAIPEPERLRLSVGPRLYLERSAKEILSIHERFQLVDGQTFIDRAAPTSDLTLAHLLEPDAKRLIEFLDTDYLVLIGQPETIAIDELKQGPLWSYSKQSTSYWAAVIDTRRMQLIAQLTSESVGSQTGAIVVIPWEFIPDTEGSAHRESLRQIGAAMAASKPSGQVRFVLLAVEPIPVSQ